MNKKILPPKRQDLPQTEELNAQTVDFSFAGSSKMFDQMQRENLNAVKAVAKAKKQILKRTQTEFGIHLILLRILTRQLIK